MWRNVKNVFISPLLTLCLRVMLMIVFFWLNFCIPIFLDSKTKQKTKKQKQKQKNKKP